MDDVREIRQMSSVEVQQVRNGIQVLARLLSEVLAHRLVGLPSVCDGLVQAHRIGLLVQLKGLRKEFEGLSHFLILFLKPRHLLACELVDGGVHGDDVLVHLFGEGLESFDLAFDFLQVQRNGRRANGDNGGKRKRLDP